MANKLGRRRREEAGSLTSSAAAAPVASKPVSPHAHIEGVLRNGGQIMIGTVQPIEGAAIAHDGKKTLVMLRLKPDEPLAAVMARLELAVAKAQTTGKRVDEINKPGSDVTYSF